MFKEKQKFREPWIWIGLVSSGLMTAGIFGAGIWLQIFRGQKFGNNPMSDQGLIIAFILTVALFLGLMLLFGFAELSTLIDASGIRFRFFPFHFKYRTVLWQDVSDYQIVTYDPLRDYGGWGIKSGKKGKAFNVSGNKGLFLKLKDGRQILIGTLLPGEMHEFLNTREFSTRQNINTNSDN